MKTRKTQSAKATQIGFTQIHLRKNGKVKFAKKIFTKKILLKSI
jgi:hypothetical protein